MHIRSMQTENFKRFTDLKVELPSPVRVVLMAGPNGTGKSSVFDAIRVWGDGFAQRNGGIDPKYHAKSSKENRLWNQAVKVELHENLPDSLDQKKALVYMRSAYRAEAEFALNQLRQQGSALDGKRVTRSIDTDQTVSDNYERLVSIAISQLFGGQHDGFDVRSLRDQLVGETRDSLGRLFDDLTFLGPGKPLEGGTFHFEKSGTAFDYLNLSGGEKAAFDLILDLVVKRDAYGSAIYCIDEPEVHLNSRIHGSLFDELLMITPDDSQIWLATHSIGIMKAVRDYGVANPGSVAVLDFESIDPDQPAVFAPVPVTRDLWRRSLDAAIGDLASLVAPERLVIVEGGCPRHVVKPLEPTNLV